MFSHSASTLLLIGLEKCYSEKVYDLNLASVDRSCQLISERQVLHFHSMASAIPLACYYAFIGSCSVFKMTNQRHEHTSELTAYVIYLQCCKIKVASCRILPITSSADIISSKNSPKDFSKLSLDVFLIQTWLLE